MYEDCTSFQSGLKRFKEYYGEINRDTLSQFLDMKPNDVYTYIEKPRLGSSLEKLKKLGKEVKELTGFRND